MCVQVLYFATKQRPPYFLKQVECDGQTRAERCYSSAWPREGTAVWWSGVIRMVETGVGRGRPADLVASWLLLLYNLTEPRLCMYRCARHVSHHVFRRPQSVFFVFLAVSLCSRQRSLVLTHTLGEAREEGRATCALLNHSCRVSNRTIACKYVHVFGSTLSGDENGICGLRVCGQGRKRSPLLFLAFRAL